MARTTEMTELELAAVASRNLRYYDQRAQEFFAGTRDHDVSQNIDALLACIQGQAPFKILDFGWGPGRDLHTFKSLGHVAVGLEGSACFAQMARDYSGCEVWQQDFLRLELPQAFFDGVFANASLFHVPVQALADVLRALHAAIKPNGVLFSSNPRGNNEEGWNGERYGAYHDIDAWRGFMTSAGFVELRHFYRPQGLPREQQPWLASVWRKRDRDPLSPEGGWSGAPRAAITPPLPDRQAP